LSIAAPDVSRLPRHTLYLSASESEIAIPWKIVSLAEILPRQSIHIPIEGCPGKSITATIVRPTGRVVLPKTFAINTWWEGSLPILETQLASKD
jgi:hypothetical protein